MRSASAATWTLAALISVALIGYTYQIPVQVSDTLDHLQEMKTVPSVRTAFIEGLTASRTMLRPLRPVQTKLLLDASALLDGRYQMTLRGSHAVLIAALIVLFVAVARVRSWTDAAACVIGLTVLMGMHTFSFFLREAYPVNHFLLIAFCALATLALAFTRGGWLPDVAALVLFVNAALTLESGLLLWVVAVAAYASGLRGLSWRAIVGMSALCVGYVLLREGYLGMAVPLVGDRPTAVGIVELSSAEQIARFGGNPVALYIYNSVTSILSVLFSQPRAGRWTAAEAALRGHVAPVFYLEILSSLAATALIAWYMFGRGNDGRRRWREPIPLVFVCVVLANGIISYSYTKNEIVSVSGVFYALTVGVALRHLLSRTSGLGVALAIVLLVFNAAWAVRVAGLHPALLRAAFNVRNEWAGVLVPGVQSQWPADQDTLAMTMALKRDALSRRVVAPGLLPAWTREWWGDE